MSSVLDRFARASRSRAEAEMKEHPLALFEQLIEKLPKVRPFAPRLTGEAGPLPRIIAEMKQSSPSAGPLRADYRPRQIAMGYARVGAAALSVLTEPDEFGGDLAHLSETRAAQLPVLRKDFLVTPYQVAQSRAAGADAVLLIAAMLEPPVLGILMHAARRYGVEALVEVHDEDDLSRAVDAGASLIGVNNRDLRTLAVDLSTSERLAPRIPRGVIRVAESGIASRADIERLMRSGFEAFLVGEHLMRAADPADALWKLVQAE
jgi:indole-3-glycerol phosphate synthase